MINQRAISARINETILEQIDTHLFMPDYPYKRNRNAFLNRAALDIMRIDDWCIWLRMVRGKGIARDEKIKIMIESVRTPPVLRDILVELK